MAGMGAVAMAGIPGLTFAGKDVVTKKVPEAISKPWLP